MIQEGGSVSKRFKESAAKASAFALGHFFPMIGFDFTTPFGAYRTSALFYNVTIFG